MSSSRCATSRSRTAVTYGRGAVHTRRSVRLQSCGQVSIEETLRLASEIKPLSSSAALAFSMTGYSLGQAYLDCRGGVTT